MAVRIEHHDPLLETERVVRQRAHIMVITSTLSKSLEALCGQ